MDACLSQELLVPTGRAGVRRRDPAGRVEAGGRAQPSLPRGALPRHPITPLPTPSGSLVTVALPCGIHRLDLQGDPDHRRPHCGTEEPWEGWHRGSCSRDQAASTPPPSPRLKISAGRQERGLWKADSPWPPCPWVQVHKCGRTRIPSTVALVWDRCPEGLSPHGRAAET